MFVEGTQAVNRVAHATGAPDGASSSLPSSSSRELSAGDAAKGREVSNLDDRGDSVVLTTTATSVRGADSADEAAESKGETNVLSDPVGLPEDSSDENTQSKETQKQNEERLNQIAEDVSEKLNDSLKLRFRQDEETGTEVFQLVEKDTGDIVRQIPPEAVLEFRERFEESVTGLFFSKQA